MSLGWIVEESMKNKEKNYRFLYDKMQQTIHTILLGKMALKIHYKIGYHLETQREVSDIQNLLICVNHLNIGSLYVKDQAFLGHLNIEAAKHAKNSGDFDSALKYIKKSMELLPLHTSEESTIDRLKIRAECEHLCNNSDDAIGYYEKALEYATSKLEKGEIYELLIKLYSDISNFKRAYEVSRIAIQSFGISTPKTFIPPLFIIGFLRLKLKLRAYAIEDLIHLPESNDEDFKMTIRLLANTLQAAYQIRPELSVANALIIVKLCLERGLTKESVIGFMVFGVIFEGAILGNHKRGFDYSQLSFDMLKRFNNTTQHAEVKFVCGYFANSWIQPAFETENIWHIAYKNGLDVGDWFHTGCAAAGIVQSMFMRGVIFEEIFEKIKYFEKTLDNIGTREQYGAIISVKQALLNLKTHAGIPHSFDSEGFDELIYIKTLEGYESEHFAHYYYINKMTTLYIHKEYEKGLSVSNDAKKFSKSSKGMLHDTEYMFYHALIVAQLSSKIKNKKTVNNIKNKFILWADDCRENFLVRAYLLEGEMHRLDNEYLEAFSFYEKAIDLAQVFGQVQLVAIANRLMAELYEKLEQNKAAILYHNESLLNFNKWGMNYNVNTNHNNRLNFDVDTLIKSSEVIAKEYEFSNLLKTLIQIIVENAGAQHGFLLLKKENNFLIQASKYGENNTIDVMQELPYMQNDAIVHPVVHYVLRTKEAIVIDDIRNSMFNASHVSSRSVKSILCAPLMLQGVLKGIIYLENNLLPSAFSDEKVKLLQHLSGQIIISIENTTVYNNLEEKIQQRTRDLEATKDELKLLALTDPMTKLYNRRYFSEVSVNIFNLAKQEASSLSLIMLDIDDFKKVNDTYGHQVGDSVITTVANIVLEHTRKSDIVCRFGGEEFIILLPHAELVDVTRIAENLKELVEKEIIYTASKKALYVTVSIGVTMVNIKEDADIEASINRVDNALYKAKQSGKNKVVFYKA